MIICLNIYANMVKRYKTFFDERNICTIRFEFIVCGHLFQADVQKYEAVAFSRKPYNDKLTTGTLFVTIQALSSVLLLFVTG